ncbi:MAG TPA: GNAT family N-acetyltransferase, partial [Gemmatimonadaceae bacterium]|nr:GNAT family N-acetyltransferase [Gemmatimonadaceae bacterium]
MTALAPTIPLDAPPALTIRAARDTPPPGWDARACAAGGNVFHGSAWGRVLAASGREPWFLEILSRGEPVGFAVAGGARSRLPIVGPRRSELALNTTPWLAPSVDLGDAVRALRPVARARGFGWLECSAFATLRAAETRALGALGFTLRPRLEFPMPLGATLHETMGTMSAQHRRNVRKALDEGFTFREESTLAGAMRLRALQDTTYGRRWARGHTHARPVPRLEYRRTMQAWLDARSMRFWFAERDGVTQSALGILLFGARAYYLVGGTSAEGYRSRAAFAAFGHVIEQLCGAGITELHLG